MDDTPTRDVIDRVTARLPRRAVGRGVGVSAVAAALAAMATRPARAAERAPFPGHPRWRFVFVDQVTTNPFFVPCVEGIQDACALLGCTYQWTGSPTSNVAEMVDAMNAAIAANVDAIAVVIIDPIAFNAPTARAMEKGIPVFNFNGAVPAGSPNKRLAYVGQDLFQAGVLVGERMAGLVDSGLVPAFISTPGQISIQPRYEGARAAIKRSGKKIEVPLIATGPTMNEELSRIKAYYLGHQDLRGMFAVDGGSTENIGTVMKLYDLPKKGVHAGGFDLLPGTLRMIDEGFMDFTVDQQPYLQGFYTTVEMFMFKVSGGLVGPADINTGLKFVTKATVKPYLETRTRYEGSSTAGEIIPRSGPILEGT